MNRQPRIRQDLGRTVKERIVADRAAEEEYVQLWLEALRTHRDANDTDEEEIQDREGYVKPTVNAEWEAKVLVEERQRVQRILQHRNATLKKLREDPAHQALSAFNRCLAETQAWCNYDEVTDDGEDHDAKHISDTPSFSATVLRPYQVEGVNWLLRLNQRALHGVLADEMGLGKTFQCITLLAVLKFTYGVGGPHLVVCPKSVLGNWIREFRSRMPDLRVTRFHSSVDMRREVARVQLSAPYRFDVCVTTYEMILSETGAFRRIPWTYLIIDEAHRIKNNESLNHQALDALTAMYRLLVTGTPLQNNLHELWALLHFMMPTLFNNEDAFASWFDAREGTEDKNALQHLHRILSGVMLRRLKSEVNTGIPPKTEVYVSSQLTRKQREWYLSVITRDAENLNRGSGSMEYLHNIVMHLRKVCNHPYLMPGAEEGPPFVTDERIVRWSGKMILLDKLLAKLRGDQAGKHKVLLFSQMTRMLDIIEDYLRWRGCYPYFRIDGNTSSFQRDVMMTAFNSINDDSFIFLLSTRSGGLGINLQAANHVVLFDSDWNPQVDLQAQDRAHRIGQTRPVRVYRFITDGTIEERIYQRALKKLYLDAMVVQQGRVRDDKGMSREELLSMVRFGAEEIFKRRFDDVTDADIDALLRQGEDVAVRRQSEARQTIQNGLGSFHLGADLCSVYDFEGVDYQRTGSESKVLLVELHNPVSVDALRQECAAFGDIVKVSLSPEGREAMVFFRSQAGATAAHSKLSYKTSFVNREKTVVASREMVDACWSMGESESLGRGKRKRTTAVTQLDAPQVAHQTNPKVPPLKLPGLPRAPAFTLVNIKRLCELHAVECARRAEHWRQQQEQVDKASEEPEYVTADESAEREALWSDGFLSWTSAEFIAVKSALCTPSVDPTDYAEISRRVGSKTEGEVRDYVRALMDRGSFLLPRWDALSKRMEAAAKKREKVTEMRAAARWKIGEAAATGVLSLRSTGDAALDRRLFYLYYDQKTMNVAETVRNSPEFHFDVVTRCRSDDFFKRRLQALLSRVLSDYHRHRDGSEPTNRPKRARESNTFSVNALLS